MTAAILAIDGGNSKTDVLVLAADGSVTASARGPAFRPLATGLETALRQLRETVVRAVGSHGPALAEHVSAYLAGADLPVEVDRYQAALEEQRWAASVTVGNDTFALLRAGASAGWGVAVVCGTGCNCVGVAPDGREVRFPALGRLTGDWGGGAVIGSEALWHAVRAEDGRGRETALAAGIAAYFGTPRALDVSLGIHLGEIPRERLSELSPLVFDVADEGDVIAQRLVLRCAEEIVAFGATALRRLELVHRPAEVVLGGGILAARRPLLMDAVERGFAEQAPRARLTVVDSPPVAGAALLGLDHIGAAPEAYDRFRATFTPGAH